MAETINTEKSEFVESSYRAFLKGARVSPRKARLVIDLIRGRHVQEALDILKVTNKKSAPILRKLINSAIANAKEQATVDTDNLYITTAYADPGPIMKRFLPRAQGRATPIRKRTSHITVRVTEK